MGSDEKPQWPVWVATYVEDARHDRMPRIKSISTNAASGRGGCATAFLAAFLGLFVVVGSAAGFFMSGRPLYHAFVASSWTPTACEVVSSKVEHSGDTARADIVYRYTVGGRQYTANRYNFIPGSTNDSTVPAVVAKHSPGTTFECYVDPADPANAVINRTPTLWYYMGIPFFLMFAGIPGVIAFVTLRSRRRSRQSISGSAAATGGLGTTTAAPAAAVDSRFVSAFQASQAAQAAQTAGSAGDAAAGPLVLTPDASPFGKLVGIILICLFWNGIVGIFTSIEFGMFARGESGAWAIGAFLLLFQLVGLGLLAMVPYQLLAMMNPRPIITLSHGWVSLGGTTSFTYELKGAAHRVSALRITLRGTESAKYRRGTDTKTDTHVFHSETIVNTAHTMNIPRGTGVIRIPADTMHSFTADNNKVIWTLQVTGEIARWPNIDDTFDITVRPS